MSKNSIKQFQNNMLEWYDTNKREMPWRSDPQPYKVWISEIMLQQTRVDTVIPYFERFINEIPSVEVLSKVDDDKLLKLWEGLGYYNRARNLKRAAIKIMKEYQGIFPSTKKDLEDLPGIGTYTSGAILSIAFNQKHTAVDGNVLRVFARLHNIKTDIKEKHTKSQIKDTVESYLPEKRVGDFNQALMEIGATVCLPNGMPKCEVCPIRTNCQAYQKKTIHLIPQKRSKKVNPIGERTVLLLRFNGTYAIQKRPNTGLLAGLYEFPNVANKLSQEDIKKVFPNAVSITKLPSSTHKFSHKTWKMIGYEIEMASPLDYTYKSKEVILKEYSIPTAFKTYKECLK